jgi:hypothetical protein
MAEHASGHPPASLTVAGTLKFPVQVGISMQHLEGLMLSRGAAAEEAVGQSELGSVPALIAPRSAQNWQKD